MFVFAVVVFPAIGIGPAIRALVFRVLATIVHVPTGLLRLPANWKENNFLTDSSLPPELMPGIREQNRNMALDGMLNALATEREFLFRFVFAIVGIFLFLPAFLYRLNIKATAWFWWPLTYLLKQAPATSAQGAQRQALCWPWSNPVQRSLIVLSIGLALISLVLHWLAATSRIESDFVTSLPLAVRVSLGWGWTRLAPWHVALWIIAGTGAGMLLLAGNACSHYANGNWPQFRQHLSKHITCMTTLSRIRRLAVVALLVMSFGALLLQDPDRKWHTYVPVPTTWITALEQFYH